MKNYLFILSYVLIFIICYFIIDYFVTQNSNYIKEANRIKLKYELLEKEFASERDSLFKIIGNHKEVIDDANEQIQKLNIQKDKIISDYENKIKSFLDPSIVSDDEVTLFITNTIRAWRN